MFGITDPALIPLSEVPKLIPRPKTLTVKAVREWARVGVAGGIKLKFWTVGGGSYTTKEALEEFTLAVTEARAKKAASLPPPKRRVRKKLAS